MKPSAQENNSITSLPENASVTNDNIDTLCEMTSESPACDEQSADNAQAQNLSESSQTGVDDTYREPGFKKPLLLIGPKRGKTGKLRIVNDNTTSPPSASSPVIKETNETIHPQSDNDKIEEPTSESSIGENVLSDTKNIPVPYLEPKWGGKATDKYKLEVLKSGIILEKINLTESFHVVGRLPSCNISLAHPTISRYHAIIQYRAMGDDKNAKGFYLYDLESTHGTFWNGLRIKPRTYVRLHGGHMIRFGCSQRKYIVQAPPDDQEEESELSVTQLKEKRLEELREREIRQQEEEEAEERERQAAESGGIDWGMGEDADEETDLTENPYASMVDEELYLDDPKKTLRGWFEREGYDLQYQVEEKGIGQFLCWINLPKECFGGRSMKAEALVKGKKKESVVQCALEACRILDRHGLLRQANHESRRKKARNWEEEDYYDSDEDNFLDRTGTVERKREQRMKQAGKFEEKIETYSSLTEKHNEIVNKISQLTSRTKQAQEDNVKAKESNEDSLDAFMSNLNTSILSKSDITKMKLELQNLRKEEVKLVKLITLTKPANLPPLVSHMQTEYKEDPQQRPKLSMRKIPQVKNKRIHFASGDDSERIHLTTLSSSDTMDNEEEEEDEEEEQDNVREKGQDSTNVHRSEYEKSTLYKDETKPQDNMKINEESDILRSIDKDTKTGKQNTNIVNDKKRKKDKKSEKSKSFKSQYDQDVHSEDYSTWLPPQNQSGDGKTSLNEKYGY